MFDPNRLRVNNHLDMNKNNIVDILPDSSVNQIPFEKLYSDCK